MSWLSSQGLKCVVLCAGKGSRILPQSIEKAKVMISIADAPILKYVIDYWRKFTRDFIFVVGYKKEDMIKYAQQLPINYHFIEQKDPRGIADAVSCAQGLIPGRFIVVLGDCICKGGFNIPEGMEQGVGVWKTNNVEDIKQSYSIEIKDNLIVRVEEKPKNVFNDLCGMGFYFFDQKVFNYIKITKPSNLRNEVEITDVIQNMIEAGEKISPVFFEGDYLNITYPEDLKKAEKIVQSGKMERI